jgi:hypothetical protein
LCSTRRKPDICQKTGEIPHRIDYKHRAIVVWALILFEKMFFEQGLAEDVE